METILNRLIRLNVELEGALRVAAERTSPEAIEAAREKFEEMSSLFASLTPAEAAIQADEEMTTVKCDEAVNGEEAPSDEPSEGEIPAEAAIVETDADAAAASARAEEAAVQPKPIAVDEKMLKSDIRKAFTLNDKFRFRRELFGNNDAEFSDTLDLLATMHSFGEAEEYIYDDLQWDRDDETVGEFMEIVSSFFNIRK